MALWGKPKPTVGSTQDHIEFSEIHDGLIITKTGELRAILLVSSINFALKSEQEQNAIVYAYQNFINSLDFPIQILMQSKKLDLSKYLTRLKNAAASQSNELLRIQTVDYIDFVERLINIANIMDKKFYVVVPFMPPPKLQPAAKGLLPQSDKSPATQMTYDEFDKWKQEIDQRVQVISSGLGSVGMRTAKLNTQQIIELFYGIFNPEESNKEKLTDFEELTGKIVESELEKPAESKKNEPSSAAR